ncbi:MAG: hypothetical protein AB2L09_05840 [Coriobacteriia bacterium]
MTVPTERQNNALQMIFSFFLGLMVVAVIGVAVNTFYEQPTQKYEDELQKLYRQQESLSVKNSGGDMSAEDQAKYDAIMDQIEDLSKEQQSATELWARNTSIILIVCATLVMVVSLVRSDQLRVISNGLLLGGIGTMVYGTGWGLFGGSSLVRFFVILFAFVVSVGLGYLKFVSGRKARLAAAEQLAPGGAGASAGAAGAPAEAAAVGQLSDRIQALEERLDAVASALVGKPGERQGHSV